MGKSIISMEEKAQRVRELLIDISGYINRKQSFSFTVLLAKHKTKWNSNIMALRNIMIELGFIQVDPMYKNAYTWTELGQETNRKTMVDLILNRSESGKDYLEKYVHDVDTSKLGEPMTEEEEFEQQQSQQQEKPQPEQRQLKGVTVIPKEVLLQQWAGQSKHDLDDVEWALVKMSLEHYVHTVEDEVYISVAKRILKKVS